MPRQECLHSATGIYHVMLRGINKQDIFEDDGDCLQTELHSQVNERLWCGNTPALSIDRCLLWSYTEVMKKEKMITEPSPDIIVTRHHIWHHNKGISQPFRQRIEAGAKSKRG